jgi:predicted transcriptional regulator
MTPPDANPRRASIDQIAAVNHPLRRRLLELLALDGPATASQLAARADQLVGNVSHHLRMMARADLIEEAPELAKDHRERWWRARPVSLTWSTLDVRGDVAGEAIAAAAEQENLRHHVEKVERWFAIRPEYDDDWVDAAFSTESWVRATPDELRDLGRRITTLVAEFRAAHEPDPDGPPDPEADDREHVFVFTHAVPSRP